MAALGLSKYKNDRFQFTHTLTQRKGGTEYTVATDGRRITVISTSTYKEDTDDTTQEWHSNKGEKSKENEQAPKWTQVIPAIFRGETSVDLSYYSFLGKGLKGPAKDKHIDSPPLDKGQYIVVNSTNGFLSLNPIYVRDAYKQIVDLGKKLGFPPIVKLQYNDAGSPVKFSAEHNGIKWQYVLMPVHRNQEATPGDIILGQQPTIYGEQDTGSFSLKAKPTYTVINDNVGLQEHLNDAVTPIEINFTPTRKKGGEWVKEALDYYLQELAGQSLPIGNTGYTLHVKSTKNRAKLATYNASSQPRSAAFKKIKEVIAKSYRIGSETSESREKQSTERADRVKRTATFERFGYPAIINGEACLIWFTGQTKQADAKDVLLAETGVTARNTTGATSPLAASSADGGDIAPAIETLGDTLANVKGKIKGVPEIIKNPQQETSVSSFYLQPIVDTWNSLLANPHFAHRLEGTIGSERLKKLRTGLDLLVNAAWGDTQLHGAFAKFCSFVQSGRAISLLSGNLGILVRQLTAQKWRYDAALWSNGKAMNDAGVQKSGKKMTNEKVVNHATKKGRRRVVFSLQCLRATGIEPVSHAWEARVLPLNDARALRGALYRCA